MKLFKISQIANDGYDTFDSAIVAAPDLVTARCIKPGSTVRGADRSIAYGFDDWTTPENVTVEYIGEAVEGTKKGVILASFNAV